MSSPQSPVFNLLKSAERFPDRVAIQDTKGCITFSRLFERSCAIATFLRRQGLIAGERVALVLQNGEPYVSAYFGVLMAGGIAVALNTLAKSRDLETWLRHCDPAWVFGRREDRELVVGLSALGTRIQTVWSGERGDGLNFEDIADGIATVNLDGISDCNQPASIIYTSGTTGHPKGVVLSHANLASNASAIVQYLNLTESDSIVTVLPFYYSYGNSVLQSHLLAGGRIVIEQNFVYPHLVAQALARERATGFAGVPSTFALLMGRVKLEEYDLTAMRYLTQAGGPMSVALTQRIRAALPAVQLFVMYGQTEATARITFLPPVQLDRKSGSVGIAIPGVEVEVRTDTGLPAAPGVFGEVWVRGSNVMLGYWLDAAATANVIRDGWLATGDLGSMDDEGFLYLAGRRSDMIKVGAHRVHPQDIEEVIAELPAVQEVAVAGTDDELLGQAVKAFVVVHEGAAVSALQVKSHCQQRLAAYKVPKIVEIVATLPKTASGKIRRAELTRGQHNEH